MVCLRRECVREWLLIGQKLEWKLDELRRRKTGGLNAAKMFSFLKPGSLRLEKSIWDQGVFIGQSGVDK